MKIDNFTTARCKKCGWVKQFAPGKEFESSDFECDCKEVVEKLSKMDKLKQLADKLGIKYPANIGESTLSKKIKEVQSGYES